MSTEATSGAAEKPFVQRDVFVFPSNVRFAGVERYVRLLVRRELRHLIDTGEFEELEQPDSPEAREWAAALDEALGSEGIEASR